MKNIREELFILADEKYREFHNGLCPNNDNIIGVRVPNLRSLAKEIAKEDWRNFIKGNKNEYYEETMLEGFVIGYAKMDLEERLEWISKFVPKIDNWAVCDCTCSTFKFIEKNREAVWDFIQKYLNSNKEFEVRFGIIILLDYYLTEDYIDKVIEKLDKIKQQDYYVKMAIAWTLQVAYVKNKEKVISYLKTSNLDNFTYNKALQKMTESNRISKEEKDLLRKMKKKD